MREVGLDAFLHLCHIKIFVTYLTNRFIKLMVSTRAVSQIIALAAQGNLYSVITTSYCGRINKRRFNYIRSELI